MLSPCVCAFRRHLLSTAFDGLLQLGGISHNRADHAALKQSDREKLFLAASFACVTIFGTRWLTNRGALLIEALA